MARAAAGTYINLEKAKFWQRSNRVVTIAPNIRKIVQSGAIKALKNARADGTVIAPYNLPHDYELPYNFKEIGYMLVQGSPETKPERVVIRISETTPALVLLENDTYLKEDLYGLETSEGMEDQETLLKKIAFFNRAAITLLREADINARIMHIADWPAALSLLYLEEENSPVPAALFTYPSARFQGLFDAQHLPLLGLTGQRPRDLKYYSEISLAQVGMLKADITITRWRDHIENVIKGIRPEGGDWGGFQKLFKGLSNSNRLFFLYNSLATAERVARIDMLSPRKEELDDIFGALLRYNGIYESLAPQVDITRISYIKLYEAAEAGVDFASFSRYARILAEIEPDAVPAVKAVIKGFGSKKVLNTLALSDQSEKNTLLQSLQKLSINWYLFAKIARRTLFGKPRIFEDLQAVKTLPLLDSNENIKEMGIKALQGKKDAPYSDLLIVTMAGGLGQRLRFAIQISSDLIINQSDLSGSEIEQLEKLENSEKINMHFESEEDQLWYIPQNIFQEIGSLSRYSSSPQSIVKIPGQILSDEVNEILAQAGTKSLIDSKQDQTWIIPAEDFQKLLENLRKSSDFFERILLDQTEKKLSSAEKTVFVNISKGAYKLPGSTESLFEMQARALAALGTKIKKKIRWGIMLGKDNQVQVKLFFRSNFKDGKYFGAIGSDQVVFETQSNNPIVGVTDAEKQKFDLVLDPGGKIITEANGHGGFHDVASRMLNSFDSPPKYVLGCNIENVLFNLQLGNLDFIAKWLGQHVKNDFDVTGLCSEKTKPTEKMGIFALGDRKEQVVEYNHPSFTAREAFAYSMAFGEDLKRIYFAKDPEDRYLLVNENALGKIFKGDYPPGKANVTKELENLKPGYQLLGLHEIPSDQTLHLTDNYLHFTGESKTLKQLGRIALEYSQGNTNIFIFNREFIQLVVNNPTIMSVEEHKRGDHRQGHKIESAIFGPLAEIRALEAQLSKGRVIQTGFIEESRENCFEPVKGPGDVKTVISAQKDLLERF